MLSNFPLLGTLSNCLLLLLLGTYSNCMLHRNNSALLLHNLELERTFCKRCRDQRAGKMRQAMVDGQEGGLPPNQRNLTN